MRGVRVTELRLIQLFRDCKHVSPVLQVLSSTLHPKIVCQQCVLWAKWL